MLLGQENQAKGLCMVESYGGKLTYTSLNGWSYYMDEAESANIFIVCKIDMDGQPSAGTLSLLRAYSTRYLNTTLSLLLNSGGFWVCT